MEVKYIRHLLLLALILIISKISVSADFANKLNEIGNIGPKYDNADVYYAQAINLYTPPDDLVYSFYRKNIRVNHLTGEQQKALNNWISQNNQSLSLFKKGSVRDFYWPGYSGSLVFDETMSAKKMRLYELSLAAIWDAKLKLHSDNFDDAFDNLTCSYRLGKHLSTGPKSLLTQMVGQNIKKQVCFGILAEIDADKITQDQISLLSNKFRVTIDFNSLPDIRYEKLAALETV